MPQQCLKLFLTLSHATRPGSQNKKCVTKNLRQFLAIFIISSVVFAVPANAANLDFESPLPPTFFTVGINIPSGDASPTFVAAVESGVLRLSDPNSSADGGTFGGFAGIATEVFTDVTVSVQVNVTNDTDSDLGVVARTNLDDGNAYYGSVDFDLGNACITKIQNISRGEDISCTAEGLLDTAGSYYLQLTATGSSPTNLKLDVFDTPGGALLATVNAVDDGTIQTIIDGNLITDFGPDYTSGVSGMFIVPRGNFVVSAVTNPVNGTFDNFSSVVPEPSGITLVLLGFAALVRIRRQQRV